MARESSQSMFYAADMTKILSAESFITAHVHPFTSRHGRSDPRAHEDLCELVDLLCNDTLLHFRSPPIVTWQPGPLQQLWSKLAAESARYLPLASKDHPDDRAERSVSEDAAAVRKVFADYVSGLWEARDVVSWVAFQVSDPRLQDIFWPNNKEEELADVVDSFLAGTGGRVPVNLSYTIQSLTESLMGCAKPHLHRQDWTEERFLLAYAFWGFIKGVRLARTLDDRYAYAVHWLRRHAVTHADDATYIGVDSADIPVPWGCLFRTLLKDWPAGTELSGLNQALSEVRLFTQRELSRADTPRRREEFLRQGLYQAATTLRLPNPTTLLQSIADKVAEVGSEMPDPDVKLASAVIQKLARRIPGARVKQQVRLLVSSNREGLREFIQTGSRGGNGDGSR